MANGLNENSNFADFIRSIPKDSIYKSTDGKGIMISIVQDNNVIPFLIKPQTDKSIKNILDLIPEEKQLNDETTDLEDSGIISAIALELNITVQEELVRL